MKLKKEYIYHFILAVLLSVFMFFDEEKREFESGYLFIAGNYMLCAIFISYVLIPFFYYKKRIAEFCIYTGLAVSVNVFIEELVIEPICFDAPIEEELSDIIFSFAHAVPAMIILVGFKFLWDANAKRKQLDELKQLMVENKMQLLKSQINPHFLFNNLNNIYSYAVEQSPKTPSLIYELSHVLRYMLYNYKEKYVLLKDEVQHLWNYIKLNELQMEHRGKVEFVAGDFSGNYKISPSILIVFVENAFKHSLSSLTDKVRISIKLEVLNDILNFYCENNYSQNSNLQDISGGIGLNNVKTQLKLVYPDAHELTIKKEENLYAVKLTIDLKERTDDKLYYS